MRARFYSDINLENFTDEALEIHGVEVRGSEGNRDVKIVSPGGDLTEELTALVHINGGDVIRGPAE